MGKLFILLIVPFLFAGCITKKEVENNYFVYSDGEWIQVDENPMKDEEVVNDEDKIVPDEDQIIPDSPIITDSNNEIDVDYFEEVPEPDEDEEISRDFDYLEIPDEDMCDNPCKLLYGNYDGKLCQKNDGKKIRLYVTSEQCRCQTKILFTSTLQDYYFFGYYFPLKADDSEDIMDLGTYEMELRVTISGEKQIFICN